MESVNHNPWVLEEGTLEQRMELLPRFVAAIAIDPDAARGAIPYRAARTRYRLLLIANSQIFYAKFFREVV